MADATLIEKALPSLGEQEVPSAEGLITVHRVMEAYGTDTQGLDLLRKNLFDSRNKIALSALEVLGRLKDRGSVGFITRLFNHADEEIQCASVKAIGEIGQKEDFRVLLDFFKTTQNERLRSEILNAVAKLAADEPEFLHLLRAYEKSPMISADSKAQAIGLLIQVDEELDLRKVLVEILSDSTVHTEVYKIFEENRRAKEALIECAADVFNRLSIENRIQLITVLSPFTHSKSRQILFDSLKDINPEIRRACYSVIGKEEEQRALFESLSEFLSERVENSPSLEEEVICTIRRMEECIVQNGEQIRLQIKNKILGQINDLFTQMRSEGRRVVSDSHELGWIIVHAKEYLEFYADEDLKQAIVRYLKGSGNYSTNDLLRSLKNSAAKVEVRHFEGYNCLLDVIKNPKRHGIVLVARELALAKLGMRKIMYQIIRNLHLTRLFDLQGKSLPFFEIYSWAKDSQLYRLAEAALYALAKVNPLKTESACIECMLPPIQSKILTIASIRLLQDLKWGQVEPTVVKLIGDTHEPYLLLNLIDALSVLDIPFSTDLTHALLNRLVFDTDEEIVSKVGVLLGEKADPSIFENLIRIFYQSCEFKKLLILPAMRSIAQRTGMKPDLALSEFLYRVLREEGIKIAVQASTLLYRLGDDYSIKILRDLIEKGSHEEKIQVLRDLKGNIKPDIVPALVPLLREESGSLQETLRETLFSISDSDVQRAVVQAFFSGKRDNVPSGEMDGGGSGSEIRIDFSRQKSAYKFEREHIQNCAVFFTDIKGYTKRSQELSSMELATLIQEYEGMLLPIIHSHEGALIKRMGDGHLFIFGKQLNAVLAGIRLQKALKRYNSYREEKFRINIRVGIHWGDVVRKEDDVLGSTVNIASRLETSAKEGSVYISYELYEPVQKYVHCREIGPIEVKGIEKPIMVYEPYELAFDLPGELDPLKRKSTGHSEKIKSVAGEDDSDSQKAKLTSSGMHPAGARPSGLSAGTVSGQFLINLKESFITLNNICIKVENGEAPVLDIRKELKRRWHLLMRSLQSS